MLLFNIKFDDFKGDCWSRPLELLDDVRREVNTKMDQEDENSYGKAWRRMLMHYLSNSKWKKFLSLVIVVCASQHHMLPLADVAEKCLNCVDNGSCLSMEKQYDYENPFDGEKKTYYFEYGLNTIAAMLIVRVVLF